MLKSNRAWCFYEKFLHYWCCSTERYYSLSRRLLPSVRLLSKNSAPLPHHFRVYCYSRDCWITDLLAIWKGAIYPFARVALVSLMVSVALELGLAFATASWGKYGLIAVGQATTSFAVMLAFFLFDSSLQWLTYPTAAVVCLLVSCIWMVVLIETGLRPIRLAVAVGLGGWVFAILNHIALNHTARASVSGPASNTRTTHAHTVRHHASDVLL